MNSKRRLVDPDKISQKSWTKSEFNDNIGQKYVTTTEDKIRICLQKHLPHITLNKQNHEWIAPTGVLLTLIATLVTTSEFKDFIIPKHVWHATFILAVVFSFAWLLRSLYKLRKFFKLNPYTFENAIKDIIPCIFGHNPQILPKEEVREGKTYINKSHSFPNSRTDDLIPR